MERTIGPSVGPMDLLGFVKMVVRIGTVAVCGGLFFFVWQDRYRNLALRLLLPMIAFTALALFSTLWSPLKVITAGQALSLASQLALAAALAVWCRDWQDLSRTFAVLTVMLLAISCLALAVHFLVPSLSSLTREENNDGLIHPTNASANAYLGLVLLQVGFFVFRWKLRVPLALVGLLVHGLILTLALNRAGFVALMLASLVIQTVCGSRKPTASLAALTCISLLGYLAIDPQLRAIEPLTEKVGDFAARGQNERQLKSLSGRDVLWKKIWDSHLESPWIGHGYFVTTKTGVLRVWNTEENRTAHNFVLQILVTTGWIGLSLWTIGLLVPIGYIARRLRERTGDRNLLYALGAVLLWFTVWGLTNESITGPTTPETVAYFVILGSSLGYALHRPGLERSRNIRATGGNPG